MGSVTPRRSSNFSSGQYFKCGSNENKKNYKIFWTSNSCSLYLSQHSFAIGLTWEPLWSRRKSTSPKTSIICKKYAFEKLQNIISQTWIFSDFLFCALPQTYFYFRFCTFSNAYFFQTIEVRRENKFGKKYKSKKGNSQVWKKVKVEKMKVREKITMRIMSEKRKVVTKKRKWNRILNTKVLEVKEKPKSQSTLQGVSFCVITQMHEYRVGSSKMLRVLERLDSNL